MAPVVGVASAMLGPLMTQKGRGLHRLHPMCGSFGGRGLSGLRLLFTVLGHGGVELGEGRGEGGLRDPPHSQPKVLRPQNVSPDPQNVTPESPNVTLDPPM